MDEHEEVASTPWENLQAEASHLGYRKPDQCWILTDRDVWVKNPYYQGPMQPYPEWDN